MSKLFVVLICSPLRQSGTVHSGPPLKLEPLLLVPLVSAMVKRACQETVGSTRSRAGSFAELREVHDLRREIALLVALWVAKVKPITVAVGSRALVPISVTVTLGGRRS